MPVAAVSEINVYVAGPSRKLLLPYFMRSSGGKLHPVYTNDEGYQVVDTEVYLCDKTGNPLFF